METGKRKEKAFDFAADIAKQLITLSTAIIAATTAFHKDIFGHEPHWRLVFMCLGWVSFLLSTLGGIVVLMGCTGALSDRELDDINLTPRLRNIVLPARFQVSLFIFGLSLSIAYALTGSW